MLTNITICTYYRVTLCNSKMLLNNNNNNNNTPKYTIIQILTYVNKIITKF